MTTLPDGPLRVTIAARRPEDRAEAARALLGEGGRLAVVTEAATLGEALHRARETGADCLLLHIDLPDAGVFEAVARATSPDGLPDVPAIVLASGLGADFCVRLVAAGADDAVGRDALDRGLARAVLHAVARRRAPRSPGRLAAGLALLGEGAGELLAAADADAVIEDLFRRVADFVGADVYFHYRVANDADGRHLRLAMAHGIDAPTRAAFRRLAFGEAVCGTVARERCTQYRPDLRESDDDAARGLREAGLGVYFCQPLVAGDELVGTLGFGSRDRRAFDEDERAILAITARHIAAVLERARRQGAERDALRRHRAAEERLRLALQSASLGTWAWDLRSGAFEWSPECRPLLGVGDAPLPARVEDLDPLVVPEDLPRVRGLRERIAQAPPDGALRVAEFRVRGADGAVRWVEVHGRRLDESAAAGPRVVGVVGDVTARRRAAEERERLLDAERAARIEADRAGRLKDDFLGTISHELRTPLNSILGWSRLLLRPGASPDTFEEGVRVIERNAKVQAQLIADLLDVNRIVSGHLQLEVDRVDVNDAAAAALETLQAAAQQRGVALDAQFGRSLPAVRGDFARLQQVVWNLVSNAIKFTPSGGRVALATRAADDHVELEVRDTGQGIAADFLPHAFERFRQGDGSASRRHGGLGLGLAIVKQLVELHGGEVSAHSDGPGTGATFRIRLPALDTVGEPLAVEPGRLPPLAPLARGSLRGVEVLLVDDQTDALEFTRRLLAEHGAVVRTATRAEEALAILRERRDGSLPQLLVSDIGMPGMDGYELLKAVRTDLGLGPDRLPAVAVTAFARDDDRRDAQAVGYQLHLTKPFQPDRLIAALGRLAPAAPAG